MPAGNLAPPPPWPPQYSKPWPPNILSLPTPMLIIPNLQLLDFYQGTQERIRNSRGKRDISVRVTEGLLFQLIDNYSQIRPSCHRKYSRHYYKTAQPWNYFAHETSSVHALVYLKFPTFLQKEKCLRLPCWPFLTNEALKYVVYA